MYPYLNWCHYLLEALQLNILCGQSTFFAINEGPTFKKKLLILQDQLFNITGSIFRRCNTCLEAGGRLSETFVKYVKLLGEEDPVPSMCRPPMC